jgi:hypothetical protein
MKRFVLWGGAVLAFAVRVCGWDYEGHRLINELALASLPTNFPAFVREPTNAERIAFLAGEADRWRNTSELGLKHANNPDHFLDLEDLPALGLSVSNVSAFRHEFVAQVALARAKDPAKFPPTDPVVDQDRTKWLPGFLPWRITEDYGRLKSAFSYLRTFEQFGGTAEEIANARGNVVYLMGLMGHFIGDTVQPLHVTRSYNGWVMANPNGYTTNRTFHAWIDGGYLRKVGLDRAALVARINPAKSVWERTPGANRDNLFPLALGFVAQQAPPVGQRRARTRGPGLPRPANAAWRPDARGSLAHRLADGARGRLPAQPVGAPADRRGPAQIIRKHFANLALHLPAE